MEIPGDEYEISQNKETLLLRKRNSSRLQASKQLWQWQRERRQKKLNIILETVVIHFLSHVSAHLGL